MFDGFEDAGDILFRGGRRAVEAAIRHGWAEVTVMGGDAVEIQVAQGCFSGGHQSRARMDVQSSLEVPERAPLVAVSHPRVRGFR